MTARPEAIVNGGSVLRDGLATLDEAAAFLSCTKAALRKWISQGRLKKIKLGRCTRVRWADVVRIGNIGLPEPAYRAT
jgi:excisionase family DNA binding protein